MYRFLFRPKWIGFHLLVIGAVVAMINLGFWQLRRLDQKQAFNATVEARYDAEPVPIDDLVPVDAAPGDDRIDEVEWRPVTATGTYVDDATIQIVNRSQTGRAGEYAVTPLVLDDGRILLVNRGFVPLGVDLPAAPGGQVDVLGRLRPTQTRGRAQLADPADGELTEAQRVDIARLAPQLDGEVVAAYVDLATSVPAEADPFPEPLPAPDLSEGNHLSYAVQWFLFSCAAVIGWFLAVRHSVRARRYPPAAPSDDPERDPAPEPVSS